jgi:hypothetical protein
MRKSSGHDRTRYEGKNLFRLLLALSLPALILYGRVVIAEAASAASRNGAPSRWLARGSYAVLAIFWITQIISARYVQHLLRPARTKLRDALQYLGVFVMCLFFSFSGAIACEAFGYAVLWRFSPGRR